MKFKVSNTKLHAQLQILSRLIASRNSVPILESVLFEVRAGKLFLASSDGENRLETWMDLDEQEGNDFSFAVKSAFLLEPLREIPEQIITFDINEADLNTVVSYLNGQFVYRAEAADQYPVMDPLREDAPSYAVPAKVLDEGIAYTLFATSQDKARPITTGICVDAREDRLSFVGTDGFLLALYSNSDVKVAAPVEFILSRKPSLLIRLLLQKLDPESLINIHVGDKHTIMSCDEFTLRCSLIAGKYPNYRSVFPKEQANVLEVDRQKTVAALRRVSMFSDKTLGMVELDLKANALRMCCRDIDYSTSADEYMDVSYSGEDMIISFKINHLLDIFSTFDLSDTLQFKLGDKTAPGLVMPASLPENVELKAMVMPLMR